MNKRRLYCYICGGTIDETKPLHILTMRGETDRVFLCCGKDTCWTQVATGTHVLEVSITKDKSR